MKDESRGLQPPTVVGLTASIIGLWLCGYISALETPGPSGMFEDVLQ